MDSLSEVAKQGILGGLLVAAIGAIIYLYMENKRLNKELIDTVIAAKQEALASKDAIIKPLELNAQVLALMSDKIRVAKE